MPSDEFKKSIETEIFRKIYNIDDENLKIFKIILEEDYKYLDEKVFDEQNISFILKRNITEEETFEIAQKISEIFKNIYSDLAKISKFTRVDEFLEYIKLLGFENFREENYIDITEKFYEAVDNIKSSERLCGDIGFSSIFSSKTGQNLYTLLIKYMEGIEIREVEKKNDTILGTVKDMSEARLNYDSLKANETFFIDIDNKNLPGNIKDNLNFTEEQRINLGFMTYEDKKNIKKYRFIQGIFNSKSSIIFVNKNMENEIERSSFLEELMLKYNLSVEKENLLSSEDIYKILKINLSSFGMSEIFEESENKNIEDEVKRDENYYKLEKNINDFENKKIYLGAYDILKLEGCSYRYFWKI